MIQKIEKIFMPLLFINFLGICGFWTFFLFNPSEAVTLQLATHILSEFLTGLASLLSFYIYIRRPKNKLFLYFSAGMLFYASIQATGWAVMERVYPLLALMTINIVVIGAYIAVSVAVKEYENKW